MKNIIRNFLVITSSATVLAGCASTSDIDKLNRQLRIVNKKIDEMKATTLGQLQKRQAVASGHMDQLEQDIMQLKSQLEESYHLNQRLREQNKELKQAITSVAAEESAKREEALRKLEEQQAAKEEQLKELNTKLQMQQESVKAIQEARIKEAERRAKEAALEAEFARNKHANSLSSTGTIKRIHALRKKVKRSVVAPPLQKGPSSSVVSTGPAALQPNPQTGSSVQSAQKMHPTMTVPGEDIFSKGNNLYQRGKYAEAYKAFEQAVDQSSSQDTAAAGRFMMGECRYQQNRFDKAIMDYQKIISQHSDSPYAPKAMLKQALSFEKIADTGTARVIYKKLIKTHGSTPEAQTAVQKMESLQKH